jgi:hypothetical protein
MFFGYPDPGSLARGIRIRTTSFSLNGVVLTEIMLAK